MIASKQAGMVPPTDKFPHHNGSQPWCNINKKWGKICCLTNLEWCPQPERNEGRASSHLNLKKAPIWHHCDVNTIKIELSCLQILSTSFKQSTTRKKKNWTEPKQKCQPISAQALQVSVSTCISLAATLTAIWLGLQGPNKPELTNEWPVYNRFSELLSTQKERS